MNEYQRRLNRLLEQYLGESILDALANPDVEEIYVNPDMRIRLVTHAGGRKETGTYVQPEDVTQLLRAIATCNDTEISHRHPSLAATFPQRFGKCRLQGFIPPITEGPTLIIRKPPNRVIPLQEYVDQKALSQQGKDTIVQLIQERKNIMVAGSTASGKTTLCNAILAEISRQFPQDRLLILEDTPELFCTARDYLHLRTTGEVSMRHLVKYSLRSTPNRIIIGEVRDGSAKDLLDAWITGHPGGCGTVHGEDVACALERLCTLAREGAGGTDQRVMVVRAVQCVVLITGHGARRRVTDIARISGANADGFALTPLPN